MSAGKTPIGPPPPEDFTTCGRSAMRSRKPPQATGGHAPKVDDAARELARALKKLDNGQGRVGRANARKGVLDQLRRLRGAVDDAYPPIAAKRKQRARKTPAQRMRALKKDGWVNVDYLPDLGTPGEVKEACIRHGIRAKAMPPARPTGLPSMWVPGWIVAAVKGEFTDAQIRAAKRSPEKRKAMEAATTLRDLELLREHKADPFLASVQRFPDAEGLDG